MNMLCVDKDDDDEISEIECDDIDDANDDIDDANDDNDVIIITRCSD